MWKVWRVLGHWTDLDFEKFEHKCIKYEFWMIWKRSFTRNKQKHAIDNWKTNEKGLKFAIDEFI